MVISILLKYKPFYKVKLWMTDQKTKISNIISFRYEEKAIFLKISGPQAKCQKFGWQKIYQTEKIYAINLVYKNFGREARWNL